MSHTEHPTHGSPGGGYEKTDVEVRGLFWFVVWLTIVCVVSAAVVWGLFRYIDRRIVERETPRAPLAGPSGELPPEPRLLVDERSNLAAYRAAQAQEVETYGWVDEPAGIVRIPIERAKALLLERGLPVRSAEGEGAAAGAVKPGAGTTADTHGTKEGTSK